MVCNLAALLPLHHDHHCTAIKVGHFDDVRTFCVLLVRWESPIPTSSKHSGFVLKQPMTSCDFSLPPIINLHITHVAYQYQSKSFNPTPPFASPTLQRKRGISIFRMNQSKPVFAKSAPIKKLTTKISRQTEFTMSQRLSAHNKKLQ